MTPPSRAVSPLSVGLQTVSARRRDVLGSLEPHEERTRRSLETMKPAQADATWQAVWQLRLDVAAALDRCEEAEREARWVCDE